MTPLAYRNNLEDKIAIVLNINARKVNPPLIDFFKTLANERTEIFVSESLEEVKAISKKILEENYGLVVTCGGDGSWHHLYNNLIQINANNRFFGKVMPYIAPLKLGTGNALEKLIGLKKPRDQIKQLLEQKELLKKLSQTAIECPLLEITSYDENGNQEIPIYATFAGSGWDARVLNDYNDVKENKKHFNEGIWGYLRAGLLQSLPKEILKNKWSGANAFCNSGEIYRVGQHHRNLNERLDVQPDEDILKNHHKINAIIAGTTPYYGYGLMAFPFAPFAQNYSKKGMMHLRVFTGIPALEAPKIALGLLGPLREGTYRSKNVLEFITNDITIAYFGGQEAVPFQISGEAQGEKQKIRYRIPEQRIKFVDFRKL